MSEKKPRCDEMVHNDFGVGSHQCPRSAKEGSTYCGQHHRMHNPEEFVPRQHQAQPEIAKTVVSIDSRLTWTVMDAPTTKETYRGARAIFVTGLKFWASTSSDRVTIEAVGPVKKADGTAGLVIQTVRVSDVDKQFAESTALEILQEINRLRDLLKVVAPDG